MNTDADGLRMSLEEVVALPLTVGIATAARALGIGRDSAYRLARNGGFPCPVLRAGRRYLVTRASLLAVLGIPDVDARITTPGALQGVVAAPFGVTSGDAHAGSAALASRDRGGAS